MDNIHIPVDRA